MSDSYLDSLGHDSIDDPFLQRAVSSIPKHSLLLIEDIDCAFPSRDETEELEEQRMPMYNGVGPPPFLMPHQSKVTLSGLLNMIDGVNSEDGKLFFATVCISLTCAVFDSDDMRPVRRITSIDWTLHFFGPAELTKRFNTRWQQRNKPVHSIEGFSPSHVLQIW